MICSGISDVPQLTLGTDAPHLRRPLGRIATFKIPNVYRPWDGWDGFPAVGGGVTLHLHAATFALPQSKAVKGCLPRDLGRQSWV
ncbi:MAG TPA: hypothetical protein VGE41_10780, partial [Verrucomicrobiae bacterium]